MLSTPTSSSLRYAGPVLLLAAVGSLVVGVVVLIVRGPADEPRSDGAANDPPAPAEVAPPDPRIAIVQPSVDRGVAYLKKNVPVLANHRPGYAGLIGFTLLECGVPPDDPAISQIAKIIRASAPPMQATYDLAASLFFLNRLDESRPLDEQDRKMAKTLALRVIAGQGKTGIWSYSGVVMNPAQEETLRTRLEQGTYEPSGPVVTGASMSNTQFAMLAVWGSRRHGIPVRAPLLALAAYCHANQFPDGHWVYPGSSLAATSTCAALMALAMESALRKDDKPGPADAKPGVATKRADLDKAFEFLGKTIGRKKGDPGSGSSLGYGGALFDADAMGDLYFLCTLERVGMIYSKERIGGKDWYDWGYPIVLNAQKPDGSWDERHRLAFGPLIDTPFALLFLKRANIAKDLTTQLRSTNLPLLRQRDDP